jgi:hypothetical protein
MVQLVGLPVKPSRLIIASVVVIFAAAVPWVGWLIVLVAAGLLLWMAAEQRAEVQRHLPNEPLELIAATVVGRRSRVAGTVVSESSLTAPVSGESAALWRLEGTSVDSDLPDLELEPTSRGRTLVVEDGSGVAEIEIGESGAHLATERVTEIAGDPRSDEPLRTIVQRLYPSFPGNRSQLRLTESAIVTGDRVEVVGDVLSRDEIEHEDATTYRRALRPRVAIGRSGSEALVLTTISHDRLQLRVQQAARLGRVGVGWLVLAGVSLVWAIGYAVLG